MTVEQLRSGRERHRRRGVELAQQLREQLHRRAALDQRRQQPRPVRGDQQPAGRAAAPAQPAPGERPQLLRPVDEQQIVAVDATRELTQRVARGASLPTPQPQPARPQAVPRQASRQLLEQGRLPVTLRADDGGAPAEPSEPRQQRLPRLSP